MAKPKNNPDTKEIIFASDEFMLKGCLHLPPAKRPPFVIGSHGLFSDKNSPKQIELARHCNDLNMAYFRFDHRGCGESKAPFDVVTSLDARCRDLQAAAKMLKARDDLGDSMGLFGSSMGGAVSLSMAGRLQAATVISWAAPIRSADLVEKHAAADGVSSAPFEKTPFDIRNQLTDLHNVLVLHGDADETVPLSHGREIYKCVAEPKKLVVFANCDHLMSKRADQKAFMRQASHWFQTFLKPDIHY